MVVLQETCCIAALLGTLAMSGIHNSFLTPSGKATSWACIDRLSCRVVHEKRHKTGREQACHSVLGEGRPICQMVAVDIDVDDHFVDRV